MTEIILKTCRLTKAFKGFTAVNDVNLKVRRGSIHALIGPNGAGKTTFFNLLTKFLTPTAGTILYNGDDIAALRRTGAGTDCPSWRDPLVPDLRGVPAPDRAGKRAHRTAAFARHFLPFLEEREVAEQAEAAHHRTSGGSRLGELRQHHEGPPALRPQARWRSPPHWRGRTILMVEHNTSVVAGICDKISVLQRGSLLAEGAYEEVSSNPQVMEAYMGTTSGILEGAH